MTRSRREATSIVPATAASAASPFAQDVQYYLMLDPRQLPSRYLYDSLGSALFEAICRLPWYRVTRVEKRLLQDHGSAVLRLVGPLSTIVELGAGSGEKLAILLGRASGGVKPVEVHLVDISLSALTAAALAIEGLDVRVTTHQGTYEEGLWEVRAHLDGPGRALVLFLGSNIGNYDPPAAEAFVRGVRSHLRPGDSLLLGTDLVKPERELLLAYDDPLGVTAAFNRNLLVRINRELGGDFDLDAFAHEAVWNAEESRVEMHLVSTVAQSVRVAGAGISFRMRADERIWTESSYKFEPGDVGRLLEPAGFRVAEQWVDRWDGFALTLAEAV
jgi:dimethylhistidine N-methyltransferase